MSDFGCVWRRKREEEEEEFEEEEHCHFLACLRILAFDWILKENLNKIQIKMALSLWIQGYQKPCAYSSVNEG